MPSFRAKVGARRIGIVVSIVRVALLFGLSTPGAWAKDGAAEALALRLYAEQAIEQERAGGHAPMADMMQELLPGLLLEHLSSRDETIALDVVDAAFVQREFETAELMEEPGLAWALDVFAGPESGFEHELRTSMTNLADFHETRAQRVTEAALKVYEKELVREEHRELARLEKAQEHLDKHELNRAEVKTAHLDRVLEERKAERAAEKAEEKAEKVAEKAEAKAEKVAEKAEAKAEKAAEKAEEKAEKVAEKAEAKAEQAAEKAEAKAEKAAEKAAEKVEAKAEKAEEKAEKSVDKSEDSKDQSKDDANDKGKKK